MYILFYGIYLITMVAIIYLLMRYGSEKQKCYKLIGKILLCVSVLLISILVIDLFMK